MPYITSIEQLARREGKREGQSEGIEVLLQMRFGDEGLKLMLEINEIHEEETLRAILKPSQPRSQSTKCGGCGRREVLEPDVDED